MEPVAKYCIPSSNLFAQQLKCKQVSVLVLLTQRISDNVFNSTLCYDNVQIPIVAKQMQSDDDSSTSKLDRLIALFQNFSSHRANLDKIDQSYPSFLVFIYGFVKQDGYSWIFMEKMAHDLNSVLHNPKVSLSLVAREQLMQQVIMAVFKLHQLSIAHRDLKPVNFVVDSSLKHVKLCGFGSVRTSNRKSTIGFAFGGTVQYMAPERFLCDEYSDHTMQQYQASDIYSMGVVLAEIATQCKPFAHHSNFEQLFAKRMHAVSDKCNLVGYSNEQLMKIPIKYQAIINSCLQMDPENRPISNAVAGAVSSK